MKAGSTHAEEITSKRNPEGRSARISSWRRFGAFVALVAAALSAAVVGTVAPASAGGGYPHDNAYRCDVQANSPYSWCVDANGNGRFDWGEQWSSRGFDYKNCTDFVAWKVNSFGIGFSNTTGGRRFGNAANWDDNARALGWTVSTTPKPRSIGVRESGHVVFVESVNANGTVNYSDYNGRFTGEYGTGTGTFDSYIYVPGLTQTQPAPAPTQPAPAPTQPAPAPTQPAPAPTELSRYANTLVRWDRDSVTTWFVTPDLRRLWIPDGGTFYELKARGFAGPYSLNAATLDRLPDMNSNWVASGSTWTGNRTLRRGMSVRSSDGRYRFAMQSDGNLVLYGPSGRALWATSWRTSAWRSQEYVIFQGDGNLVTYGGGRAIWASGTGGRGGTKFVVQSDGNLVIYAGSRAIWASNTAGQT